MTALRNLSLASLLAVSILMPVHAGFVMELPDGRKVELFKDKTWDFYKEDERGEGEEQAVDPSPLKLTITRVGDSKHRCKLGISLVNKSSYYVTSLVPRITGYVEKDVPFDTKSFEFSRMRPSQDQYREITFRGISCAEIDYFRVHGGNRCTMGDFDKFMDDQGACLKQVQVIPHEQIKVGKAEPK